MLTKLRYAAGEGISKSSDGQSSGGSSDKADPAQGLQIVGMSATMPNVAAVADWLQVSRITSFTYSYTHINYWALSFSWPTVLFCCDFWYYNCFYLMFATLAA